MKKHLFIVSLFTFLSCQGSLEYYGEYSDDDRDLSADPTDTGYDTSSGDVSATKDVGSAPGLGGDMGADLGMDTGTEPEPEPTTDAIQEGPTVRSLVATSCSTIAVKGLSTQLIDQMNCEVPGIMKTFAGSSAVDYSAVVFPFMQGPATDRLILAGDSRTGKIPINSALRTIAQQYLLYAWYTNNPRLCNANLAATPGNSNHNGGAAVDIGSNATWKASLIDRGFIDNVSSEPWHFKYNASEDVRSLSTLAFQKLYNRNFPTQKIDEDGVYGPMTAAALANSPGEGFTREPVCEATRALPTGARECLATRCSGPTRLQENKKPTQGWFNHTNLKDEAYS